MAEIDDAKRLNRIRSYWRTRDSESGTDEAFLLRLLDARDAALREAHEEIENLQADASNDGLRYREMRTEIEALRPVAEAARRHIASYDPGTLIGSELNLALHLRDIDGDMWAPWCVPGTIEDDHQKPETGKGEGQR